MSLLMDALKKAEEAKRLAAENQSSGTGTETSANTAPALELLPVSPSPEPSMSEASSSFDPTEADLSRTKQNPASPDERRRESAEKMAARNVFAAKQAPQPRRGLGILAGLAMLIGLTLVGYYGWQIYSLDTKHAAFEPRPAVSLPAAPNPAPVAAATRSEPVKPAVETVLPSVSDARSRNTPAAGLFEPAPRQPKPSASASAAAEGPVRLAKSQPRSNAMLDQAYAALQAGRFDDAYRGYEQILRADARNLDALLGLATIAARQGRNEEAQDYYLRAFDVDPKDPTAQAGVINTRGKASPAQSESQLKTALAGQPDSAALHFALGNLLAAQSRWSEAQQAYFNAYSADPENPDLIFNLAVSLDHLRQNKLAAQYYRMALKTANNSRTISFDPDQVKARLGELQP